MKTKMMITDTVTYREFSFSTWRDMAKFAIEVAERDNDYARYLPSYDNWNLDYPERNEDLPTYTARLIDMAIGLQLIG